jgi:ubiquitin C-terminal hydrolase
MESYHYDLYKHHQLKYNKNKYIRFGLTGLVNLGNRCYSSSILQCLSNTLKLTDKILIGDVTSDTTFKNQKRKEWTVLQSYLNLIRNMWDSNQLLKPRTFIETFGKLHNKFMNNRQHDSHEFFMYLLDTLHTALSYEIQVDIQGVVENEKDKLMKESIETWKLNYSKNYSFLVDLFHGMTKSTIQCTSCNNESNIFEPYTCLSLPISGNNINECMDSFFKNSEIVNSWVCEKCKNNGCKKETSIWSFPDYLVIQLKRFTPTGHKNTDFIDYPLQDLDVSKYTSPDKGDPNNYIYELYAINYHSGGTNSGHYWSACKNLDGNWYLYNDASVSKYSENTMGALISKEAYLLFYQRKYINPK